MDMTTRGQRLAASTALLVARFGVDDDYAEIADRTADDYPTDVLIDAQHSVDALPGFTGPVRAVAQAILGQARTIRSTLIPEEAGLAEDFDRLVNGA